MTELQLGPSILDFGSFALELPNLFLCAFLNGLGAGASNFHAVDSAVYAYSLLGGDHVGIGA